MMVAISINHQRKHVQLSARMNANCIDINSLNERIYSLYSFNHMNMLFKYNLADKSRNEIN